MQLPLVYVPGNHDVDLAALHRHRVSSSIRSSQTCGGPSTASSAAALPLLPRTRDRPLQRRASIPASATCSTIFAGLFEDQNKSPLLASGETVEAVLEQFGESMLALWTCATAGVSAQLGIDQSLEPRETLTPVQNPDRLRQHVDDMRVARERERWDVAVLGHTHKLGRVGDWYHNSGTWVGAKDSFLRIDPEGHVRYFEWKEGHALELEAPCVFPDGATEKNPLKKAAASVRLLFPRPTRPERSRLVLMAQGALALGLGVWGFIHTFTHARTSAVSTLIWAFGLYALGDGTLSLLAASRQQPVKRLLDRMRGSVSILLGLVFLTKRESLEVFAVLVGMWALLEGFFAWPRPRCFAGWWKRVGSGSSASARSWRA